MSKVFADYIDSPAALSSADLRALGRDEVGYVRKYDMKSHIAFVLHAADGTAVAVQKNEDAAYMSAQQHGLELVSVH